jgi:ribonuclease BN (tRNA processing enzyme)
MQNRANKARPSVTILGSGTCVPSLNRSACSVLLTAGGQRMVFDLGPGTMQRLLMAGVTIFEVGHVFFSHFHPDHTGELVPFLFANKYPDGSRRKIPLTLHGGTGFLEFYTHLKKFYKNWIDLSGRLKIIEYSHHDRDFRRFKGFRVDTLPVAHNPESIAFRITLPGGATMVYSGDTDYTQNLVDLAKTADLFICESAFPDAQKVAGHLTPSLAGQIAAAAGVKHLVLTHLYPECERADLEGECRKTYAGPLLIAKDLMTIQLKP